MAEPNCVRAPCGRHVDPWLFFVAGIWLIILVIHALRTYLGRAVGPIGRYIRWPMTPAEVGREVERLKPVDGASQSTMRGGRTLSIAPIAGDEMRARVDEVLNRWPAAGLAVGVVRDGSLAWFHGHGVADASRARRSMRTPVFRIASISKTITAIAVMQLWEQALVEPDAPADDYLAGTRWCPPGPALGR